MRTFSPTRTVRVSNTFFILFILLFGHQLADVRHRACDEFPQLRHHRVAERARVVEEPAERVDVPEHDLAEGLAHGNDVLRPHADFLASGLHTLHGIVRVLLENYGYEVLDLGKDVAPELITETAIREDISLVGLSALMTTTVVSMEETIRLLREKKPDVKVVVGGAVMNREYADSIGADYYAKEAMDTVRYADSIFL